MQASMYELNVMILMPKVSEPFECRGLLMQVAWLHCSVCRDEQPASPYRLHLK